MARGKPQLEMLQKVALLVAENATPKDMMSLLGVSRSTVTRLLQRLDDAKDLLEKTYRVLLPDEVCVRLHDEIYGSRELEEKLQAHAGRSGAPPLARVKVFPSGVQVDNDDDWDRAAVAFGRMAAADCFDLVRNCRAVGIAYGRTLRSVVSGIAEAHARLRPPEQEVVCVPLWGSPLSAWKRPESTVFTDPTRLSATGLASDLHYALNGPTSKAQPLSLDFVPAFRPRNYPRDKFNVVLEFACRVSSYGKIFGTASSPDAPPRLIDRLDALLASVGSSDRQPGRFWSGEFFEQGDIPPELLQRATIGDLGGAFLPKPQALPEDRAEIEDIARRWTGVQLEHYRATADRARRENRPGVVVLAVGAARAEIILALIERGLINHLLIDADCARAIKKLLQRTARG